MKFIINNLFLICIIIGSGFLLLLPKLQRRGPHLNTFLVTKKMNEGKVVVLDISKPAEFEEGHIRGAINIPQDELPDRIPRIERFKGDSIIVVCPKGTLSPKTTATLKKEGFADVSSMEGGMKEWMSQNFPFVTGGIEEEKTLPARMKKKKGKAKA